MSLLTLSFFFLDFALFCGPPTVCAGLKEAKGGLWNDKEKIVTL